MSISRGPFYKLATGALTQAMMLGLPSLPRNVSSRVKVQGSRFRDTSNSLPRSFEDVWTYFLSLSKTYKQTKCLRPVQNTDAWLMHQVPLLLS